MFEVGYTSDDTEIADEIVGYRFPDRSLSPVERIEKTRNNLVRLAAITLASDLWREESAQEQLSHINTKHLSQSGITQFGVPIFDIGLCVAQGFSLEPVCENIYRLLANDNILPGYRNLLIKTLLYIDQQQPGRVQWPVVAGIYADYRNVTLDLAKDTLDSPFDDLMVDGGIDRSCL